LPIFYKKNKNNVGTLKLKWFISDLADQYYSGWVATFIRSLPPQKLFVPGMLKSLEEKS